MHYFSPVYEKQVELGLGPYPLITLADALRRVREHQLAIFHGRCPLHEKREKKGTRKQTVITFGTVATAYFTAHQASWRSVEHRRRGAPCSAALAGDTGAVGRTLRMQAKPVIVERLRWRIWNGKARNAKRCIDRVRKVMHVYTEDRSHNMRARHLTGCGIRSLTSTAISEARVVGSSTMPSGTVPTCVLEPRSPREPQTFLSIDE
jgi:hypothetical protein